MCKRHYDVACGVITDDQNRVLVALRDKTSDQGGLWEFPGGKVEIDEDVEEALLRELTEELGIYVVDSEAWVQVDHEYANYHVTLYVFKIHEFDGEPVGAEGQVLRWVSFSELSELDLPEANLPIVDELLADA